MKNWKLSENNSQTFGKFNTLITIHILYIFADPQIDSVGPGVLTRIPLSFIHLAKPDSVGLIVKMVICVWVGSWVGRWVSGFT